MGLRSLSQGNTSGGLYRSSICSESLQDYELHQEQTTMILPMAQDLPHWDAALKPRSLAQNGLDVNAYHYDNPVACRLRGMSRLPTQLHIACYEQNVPAARALLQCGADPGRMVLEAGRLVPPTVLETARAGNNQELLDLLACTTI